jgi:hypothetical protein
MIVQVFMQVQTPVVQELTEIVGDTGECGDSLFEFVPGPGSLDTDARAVFYQFRYERNFIQAL